MTDPWVIVGCGRAKHQTPMAAADIYTGGYVVGAVAWARSVTSPDRLLILSAKYGLIVGTTVIPPYSASFTSRGFAGTTEPLEPHVTTQTTRGQIAALGLTGRVITLAGKDYFAHLTQASRGRVVPYNPFFRLLDAEGHDHRIGYQRQAMKRFTGRLPQLVTA